MRWLDQDLPTLIRVEDTQKLGRDAEGGSRCEIGSNSLKFLCNSKGQSLHSFSKTLKCSKCFKFPSQYKIQRLDYG